MLGSFLARAVIDEVLPPAFLSNRNNTHPGDEVVAKAVSLLSREHCSARLEKVWGPGDGRPVEELKEIMDQLLKVCCFHVVFVFIYFYSFRNNDVHLISPSIQTMTIYPRSISSLVNSTRPPAAFVN